MEFFKEELKHTLCPMRELAECTDFCKWNINGECAIVLIARRIERPEIEPGDILPLGR